MNNSARTTRWLAADQEEAYEIAWQISADAMVLTDATGVILDVNPAYGELFNVARENAIGSNFTTIFPADQRQEMLERYRAIFEATSPPDVIERHLELNGRDLIVESRFTFLPCNGRRLTMLACIRDVTGQKRRESTLMRQTDYEHALAQCSSTLVRSVPAQDQRRRLLNEALEHLRIAVRADRAYLFENIDGSDPVFCMRAEACAPDVTSFLHDPASQQVPRTRMPESSLALLANGRAVGGPLEHIFAGKPESIAWLHRLGIQSCLFLPIHVEEQWWGYVGFDDCTAPRAWDDLDVRLLQTAAELFSGTLQRWRSEEALRLQSRYQQALARCSQTLLSNPDSLEKGQGLLSEALDYLLQAVGASRAYVIRNIQLPESGLCANLFAEVCAPDVQPHIQNPINQFFPWVALPEQMRRTLEAGEAFGGPVHQAFAGESFWLAEFSGAKQPLLSVQQFPIHFGMDWWGLIGFDDVVAARQWSVAEIRLLRTASEIVASTLQRWEANEALKKQYRYQQGLADCAQVLLEYPDDDEHERRLLTAALEHLRPVLAASRAYVFRNRTLPGSGLCMEPVAEVCAPEIASGMERAENRGFPWSQLPDPVRRSLEAGRPVAGAVDDILADDPALLEGIRRTPDPVLSILQYPIFLGDEWWGYVGFDDAVTLREWQDTEHMLLFTAAEIISSALQRWQDRRLLEQRVQERTADLLATNRRLRAEIGQRERAEADLAQHLKVERTLTKLSTRLLEQDNSQQALTETLRGLGQIVRARRVVLVYLVAEESPFETDFLQWHAARERPFSADLFAHFRESCPWLWQSLLRGETIQIDALAALPQAADVDRAFLATQGVDALALFPMLVEDRLTAVLACSNFDGSSDRRADRLRVLQLGANLVENMLRREAVLATLERRVASRTQELSTLFDVTLLAGEAESLPEVLEPAVRRLAEVGYCDSICIHLYSQEEQTLTLVAQRGLGRAAVEQLRTIALGPGQQPFLDYTRRQPLVGSRTDLPDFVPDALKLPAYQAYFGAQLRFRSKTVGLLSGYRSGEDSFSLSQLSLLAALADQLGIAVENHHLQRKAREMAILGERQRLARELHDSITQLLYSQTLFARAGRYALEDGDEATARDSLMQLETDTQAALKEMRLLLFQLRPFTLEGVSLREAIEQRFDDVERRLGIKAVCQFDADYAFEDDVLAELYRAVMEALNNALKHAAAAQVTATLETTAVAIVLTIADDGAGFDTQRVRSGMGLKSMQERVAHINGRLAIDSAPGAGTRVIITLPVGTALLEG